MIALLAQHRLQDIFDILVSTWAFALVRRYEERAHNNAICSIVADTSLVAVNLLLLVNKVIDQLSFHNDIF